MIPDTSKMTTRGPLAVIAARSDPGRIVQVGHAEDLAAPAGDGVRAEPHGTGNTGSALAP